MRKLLLVVALFVSSVAFAQAIIPQQANNNFGQPFVRLYNNTPSYVSCVIRDQFNYYTFSISPHTYSMWYPVHGAYRWQCK